MVIVSIFGPYVFGPFRTDHFTIYGSAAVLLVLIPALKIKGGNKVFYAYLVFQFLWVLFSTFIQGNKFKINELENITQPLVVATITLLVIRNYSEVEKVMLFKRLAKLVALLFGLHTILILLVFIVGEGDFLSHFHGGNQEKTSVAANALKLGRLTGIFNQPIESGMGYSIALLGHYYTWGEVGVFRKYLFLFLIILGGLMSVSKVFLLFVFVLFLTIFLSRTVTRLNLKHSVIFLVASILGVGIILNLAWSGLKRLERLFSPKSFESSALLEKFSGGRFSSEEETNLMIHFSEVLEESFFMGNGLQKINNAVDSVYLEQAAYGGTILLGCYVMTILFLILKGGRHLFYNFDYFKVFLLSSSLLLGLAGIGSVTFTMNRSSVPLIILLVIGLDVGRFKSEPEHND